jgi:predicted transcriptional regulator
MENHNLQLTDLENKVLEALINELYAEPGFSDVDAHDISKTTGVSTKSIRGALSSLVKKGIVTLMETDTYGADKQYVLIYLNQNFWYLHPEWKNESINQ